MHIATQNTVIETGTHPIPRPSMQQFPSQKLIPGCRICYFNHCFTVMASSSRWTIYYYVRSSGTTEVATRAGNFLRPQPL